MNKKDQKAESQESGEEPDDRVLVARIRRGDKEAYGQIVHRYKRRAYFAALGFVGSHEAALDLSQDAFIKAYAALRRFDERRKFFTWFYLILRNLCYNFLRNAAHRPRPFAEISEEAVLGFADESVDIQREIERRELQEQIWHALSRLKLPEKEIILLRDFQDYSYKEIAEILGCPLGTVMSRLYAARKSLKAELEGVLEK